MSAYLAERPEETSEQDLAVLLRRSLEEIAAPVADPREELPAAELRLLRRGGFATEPGRLGSRDPFARGALDLSLLVATGLTTREAAARLGVAPRRTRQRLLGPRPTLYGVKWRRAWLLPRFQFAGEAEVPGLAKVVPHLDRVLSPLAVALWFLSPSPDLALDEDAAKPLSPRDWLLAGGAPEVVARLAAAL